MLRAPQPSINVMDFGARGDGATDDTAALQVALNTAFGTGTGTIAQRQQRGIIIPPGRFVVRGGGLTGKNWFGGCLHGSGRFTTQIQNVDGGPVITTDGCQYMRFGDMQLDGNNGAGVLFDLDWKGPGTALQSNTFENIYFSDAGVGLRIGNSNFMGSENLISNCFFANLSQFGLRAINGNALQQTVIGGNFQNCAVGIDALAGSVPVVHGVGFQVNGQDILVEASSQNIMSIVGCRTESANFVRNDGAQSMEIRACLQQSSSRGYFFQGQGGIIEISTCIFNGQVLPLGWTRLTVRSCEAVGEAAPNDWLVLQPQHWWNGDAQHPTSLVIELENVISFTSGYAPNGMPDAPIGKRRIFSTDFTNVTTQNYTLQ
jgi:hypothetical protein